MESEGETWKSESEQWTVNDHCRKDSVETFVTYWGQQDWKIKVKTVNSESENSPQSKNWKIKVKSEKVKVKTVNDPCRKDSVETFLNISRAARPVEDIR